MSLVDSAGHMLGFHAIEVVGWGVDSSNASNPPLKYWIVKNSWSKDWGEDGYFRWLKGPDFCNMQSGCVVGMPALNQQPVRLKSDDDNSIPPPPPAPSAFTVTFATDVHPGSAGDIAVLVTRSWAPLGADRFYAAVQAGF